jgi:TonB-linked SusC/RagA family outer membrane protein
VSLMLALVLCGTALGQQVQISGFITSIDGEPLEGVTVGVQRTDIRATTDMVGRYTITAPADGVLIFSLIGYRALALDIGGRTTLDVILERAVAVLDEVIVTGYTEQRRADITGAVGSVNIERIENQTGASVLQRLDGAVSGVKVESSGAPGSRSTVRIRGVSSFQNNDPLYIIDGTPVEDSWINWLNPRDIESIQVLKDASAASIYGSRATNGVIIIETRKAGAAGAPRFTLDTRFGMATPVRGYDAFLIQDALEYAEVVCRSYTNAGLTPPTNVYGNPCSPSLPAYIWPNDGVNQTNSLTAFGITEDDYLWGDAGQQSRQIMPASTGTNWWDELFDPAMVADVNLSLAGAGDQHGYNVSFNYLNQEGTAKYNRFQRGSVRANTQFETGRLTVGQNLAVVAEQSYGGAGDPGGYAEGGILGKNILHQPIVPVYDIGGNFAAGKAVGLGNQSNAVKEAWGNKDDIFNGLKIFGNVFGGYSLTDQLQVNTRMGWNITQQNGWNYSPISPELSEPSFADNIGNYTNNWIDWTWTNTLTFSEEFGAHGVNVLLGQEASKSRFRGMGGNLYNLVTTDINARYIQDALGGTKNVSSSGSVSSLLSYFGKIDYTLADRYLLSFTMRRDGSSRLAPENRWGWFPAGSFGWRVSDEPFLRDNQFFTNIMLRFGWGITGNQNIPSGRVFSQFGGGLGDTYYAIGGGNTIVTGYRQTSLGNANLKWEENESMNVGLDLEFFRGAASLVVDLYQRKTDDMLFNPAQPAVAGVASPPIVNIGQMENRGIDVSLGYTGSIGSGTWSLTLNGSHYQNEIVRIDGVQDFFFGPVSTRYGNQVINQVGSAIGSFYGLQWDGFFEDAQAVTDHATQAGAAPGRIRFIDQDTDNDGDGTIDGPDGTINADDRVVIGSPHPDFTAGLDFALNMGDWDFSMTLFSSYGNEIFDVQKEFYVFRNFSTNVRSDLLTHSWEMGADNSDAKYPRLDQNDTFSGQQISDYYVEDGSYLRLRNLQIGYRLPQSLIPNARVYLQGENLLTLTGYSGLDPALPAASVGGAGGDIRDQYRGVDRGAYPSNRVFSFGISAAF